MVVATQLGKNDEFCVTLEKTVGIVASLLQAPTIILTSHPADVACLLALLHITIAGSKRHKRDRDVYGTFFFMALLSSLKLPPIWYLALQNGTLCS